MQELQGPAYVLRRPHGELLAPMVGFHRTAGLAVVRDTAHGQFFVAGDTWGIKTVPSTVGGAGAGDGELVPVVHSRDLPLTRSRLASANLCTAVVDSAVVGPVLTVAAPDGGLLGFAGRAPDLAGPAEVLPDGGGAAHELAGTRLVLRRAYDPARVTDFYQRVVGLRPVGAGVFDLGEGVALEVAPGGGTAVPCAPATTAPTG